MTGGWSRGALRNPADKQPSRAVALALATASHGIVDSRLLARPPAAMAAVSPDHIHYIRHSSVSG